MNAPQAQVEDLIRLLSNIHYRKLTTICGEYDLKKSGKKIEVIKRLISTVDEKTLRERAMECMGISKQILNHGWVPQHRVMKDKEVENLLDKFGIRKNQLPKVLDGDPVAMLLGARPGDVLEITRKRETSGENKYYRVVVRALR